MLKGYGISLRIKKFCKKESFCRTSSISVNSSFKQKFFWWVDPDPHYEAGSVSRGQIWNRIPIPQHCFLAILPKTSNYKFKDQLSTVSCFIFSYTYTVHTCPFIAVFLTSRNSLLFCLAHPLLFCADPYSLIFVGT